MKFCTFLKQENTIELQYIEIDQCDTGAIRTNVLLDKSNMEAIQNEIQNHFNIELSPSQLYFIGNNNKGVLRF
jgi:hypothetical protein